VSEINRHNGYANRVADLAGFVPRSVLDVGCGNGALLLALGRLFPSARLAGVEPAARAASKARRSGLTVAPMLTPGTRADLVVSVNVIEHTTDALAFLRRLRSACARGGRVVVICPCGATPWLELLMADHRYSFTEAGLEFLAARAGLAVLARQSATDSGFQAVLLAPSRPRRHVPAWPDGPRLLAARRSYMARWRALDGLLLRRRDPSRRLVCFGAGEAAHLLRAYAPVTGAEDLGKPVARMQDISMTNDQLLLAVRPQSQANLADRFAAGRALRWDTLVPR
jgi:SAM-dependent methyltransferase